MELGIVSFFNIERGFGRIKTPTRPNGVFVHFSDVLGDARILVENEMVNFEIAETDKGPKAKLVTRITERLIGKITHFNKGYGYIEERNSKQRYFLHHTDVRGNGFKKIEVDFEIEFSPFETEKGLQAKEVVISDTRYPMEKFALLPNWDRHLHKLARMAQPENWDYILEKTGGYPVLSNYLFHTFRRLEEEGKIEYTEDPEGNPFACFNTGLVTEKQEEIFAYFVRSTRKAQPNSYIRNPKWMLKEFGRESHRMMSFFKRRPQLAHYFESPSDLIYDPSRRLVPDYEHIIGERMNRFPEEFRMKGKAELIARIRNAIHLAEKRVRRNYKTAVPQYYEGQIQLLLPLCMYSPNQVDMALVVAKEHEIYRANTVIPLDWACQNTRLLAPPDRGWLNSRNDAKHSFKHKRRIPQ